MRKDEIENFIKRHTREFEKELAERKKNRISHPRTTFARTAACNVQRRRDFDQDKVIQQCWINMVDYIIEVNAWFRLTKLVYL